MITETNWVMVFTFHNVSIKSQIADTAEEQKAFFTFHNVSIKSHHPYWYWRTFSPLHSTMYLLNRECGGRYCNGYPGFTFHNVSIKSSVVPDGDTVVKNFTFHNVSIKSCETSCNQCNDHTLHSTMYLLNLFVLPEH